MVLLAVSASTPALPSLPPLGLSVADRSLLPKQRKQRFMQHKGCQTDVTELADLRLMQQQLVEVRQELSTVNSELKHAERRLRNEVQEEMEARMRRFERRTKEKVDFLKKRQESSVTVMRKALNATLASAKAQQENDLRRDYEERKAAESVEVVELRSAMQRQALLIEGYLDENRKLQAKLQQLKPQPVSKARRTSDDAEDAEGRMASLEAQLASRDATIKALREQLARYQPSDASGAQASSSNSPSFNRRRSVA